jgi:glutamine synthetase
MSPGDVQTPDDVRRLVEQGKVDYVHVGLVDFNTQLRGKTVAKESLLSGLNRGIPMDVDFYANLVDVLHEIPGLSDDESGGGDVPCRVVPESCRVIPWERPDRNLFFLLEYLGPNADFDPRPLCRRILENAAEMGFRVFYAHEYEFTIFNETSRSAFEKRYRDLDLVERTFTYKVLLRNMTWSEFFNDLIDAMGCLGVRLESLMWETGPGFAEASMQYQEGIAAADNAVIFKNFTKAFAQRREKLVTFMAKWATEAYGQSGHVHISLRDRDGIPVFFDPEAKFGMSKTMRHFLGGLQRYLPQLMLMIAPNVNSFKRFVPGLLAPIAVNWGLEDNKTVGLRVITGSPESSRIECRHAGADANPYLATACNLGAGLLGIERQIEPSDPALGDVYNRMGTIPREQLLPETFRDAIEQFRHSAVARELFGERFVQVFADYRASQERQFRYMVTDQERARFLEFV